MKDERDIQASWRLGLMGSFEEAIERLEQLHQWDQGLIAGLKNQVKELNDIKWKDNEIRSIREELENMRHDYYQGFPISDNDVERISEWQNKHILTYHNGKIPTGVSGGNWKYEFIPTSIGTVKRCVCGICDRKARKTAYDCNENWHDREVANKYINLFDSQFDFSDI